MDVNGLGVPALLAGGTLTAIAALAHLACIAIGAPAYRFMGAGERMVRAVQAGKRKPAFVTVAIAAVLLAWALFAFSGAGIIGPLPMTRFVVPAASAVYLARAVGFPLLKPRFPENSTTFWLWSSGICLVLGVLYAAGSVSLWSAH